MPTTISGPRPFPPTGVLIILLFFFSSACVSTPVSKEQQRDTRAKYVRNYEFNRDTDLADRITAAPDFVLGYWSEEDGREYTDYILSEDEIRIVRQCLADLPEIYKDIFKERLLGIYFVENFLGSGLADYVMDENGDVYTILLFNPSVLELNLSELVTRKENTCFIPGRSGISINIALDDNRPGLFYILLHEATHIIDYVNRYTPYVEPAMRDLQGPSQRKTPFCDRLWADFDRFPNDIVFAYKDRVTFYGMNNGPKIDISDAADVYRALESVPAASLYGTLNWAEDFAEYMTFFYLTQKMGTDYTITVSDNDMVLYRYQPFGNRQVLDRGRQLDSALLSGLNLP